MTNSSNQILDEINDNEEFIEAQTFRIKSLEANSQRVEKLHHHIVDNDTDFNTQHTDEINILSVSNFKMQKLRCYVYIICSEFVF